MVEVRNSPETNPRTSRVTMKIPRVTSGNNKKTKSAEIQELLQTSPLS